MENADDACPGRTQGLNCACRYACIEGDRWEDDAWSNPIYSLKSGESGKSATRAGELTRQLNNSKQVVQMSKTEKQIHLDTPFSRMRIVALLPKIPGDFGPDDELVEKTLCVLKGYKVPKATVLEMKPGFNTSVSLLFQTFAA